MPEYALEDLDVEDALTPIEAIGSNITLPFVNAYDEGVIRAGADGAATRASLQTLIDNLGSTPARIILPAGVINLQQGVSITHTGQIIEGSGTRATTINFTPTSAGQTPFTFGTGLSVMAHCGIGNMLITSSNTTLAKIGVRLTSVSNFRCFNLQIGPNGSWNGTTGGTTYGLQIQGHELSKVEHFEISCTDGVPIRIERNPMFNLGDLLDLDHWTFEGVSHVVPGAGHYGFEFEDGAQPTNLVISQVNCGGGSGLFKYINTLSPSVAYSLEIRNCRCEVATNGKGIWIDGGSTYQKLRNVVLAANVIGSGASLTGIYLRHASAISVEDNDVLSVAGQAGRDFDAVVGLHFKNNTWSGLSTLVSGANMRMTRGEIAYDDSTVPGFREEWWEDGSANGNMVAGKVTFIGGISPNGEGVWEYAMAGTLANASQQLIPLLGGGARTARIDVEAKGATKAAIGSAGVTSLSPVIGPTLLSAAAAGNDFQVGNVPGKFTVFDGGSGIGTIFLFNQTGESMDYDVKVRAR